MLITLPWPPAELSPNARNGHWAKSAKIKARYRKNCSWAAASQGARRIEADKLAVSLVFRPPTSRKRDLDNCLAAIKSGLDGLADVLLVDDSQWTLTLAMGEPVRGGAVLVELTA